MRRIGLAVAIAISLIIAPLLAEAQQARVYKIGLLCSPPGAYVAAFEESLRQLGYVRGGNVVFETRRATDCRAEELPKTVADLLRLNVEVIVTGPNLFIDAAKQATTSVPIVMVYGRDPVGRGYISSLARPGGNITGLTWDPSENTWSSLPKFLLGSRASVGSLTRPRWKKIA